MTAAMFWIQLVEPQGPRKKPITRRYVVSATSEAEALEAFDAECGEHQRQGCAVLVLPFGGRVAPTNAAAVSAVFGATGSAQ